MALIGVQNVPPLDGNAFTGPTRVMSGVARTQNVTLDTQYGESGALGEKMRWLYIGVAGDVSYVKWDGTTQLLVGLTAGVFHPIYSLMINSSGTTATDIVVGS
jgi:hypothetical protein